MLTAIRALRQWHGITLTMLAAEGSRSGTWLLGVEKRRTVVHPFLQQTIAEYLGAQVDDLFHPNGIARIPRMISIHPKLRAEEGQDADGS